MRRLRLIWLAGLLTGAMAAWPAVAAAESPVVTDCSRHDRLTRHYSVGQLRYALGHLPAQVVEYGPCQAVIQQQLLAQVRKLKPGDAGTSQVSSGGSSPLVPIVIAVVVIVLAGGGLALVARRRALQG